MIMKPCIMIVEDDLYLREELIHTFMKEGYAVLGVSSFKSPEQEILDAHPDLVVLDLNLPGKSGFELCKWLKDRCTFPILILTARDNLGDELRALGLGADDYLTKPCHPGRLLARASRLLETYQKMPPLLRFGGLSFDVNACKIMWKTASLPLPETEGRIFRLLMEHAPGIVSKECIADELWGGSDYVDENILQVNMTRLRKNLDKIGLKDAVQTVRGRGYVLRLSSETETQMKP